jgi:hypothetical protein
MLWSSIGDGAYIAVHDQSSVDRPQQRKQKGDDEVNELIDATRVSTKAKPGPKAVKRSDANDIVFLETEVETQAKPISKCRVSQSTVDRHGNGLQATSRIRPGEVIVTEKPFIIVDYPLCTSQIRQRYRDLSATERLLFHSFKPKSTTETNRSISDIVANNVVPLGGSSAQGEEPTRSGMFRDICRINHSCVPNAEWTWIGETSSMGK